MLFRAFFLPLLGALLALPFPREGGGAQAQILENENLIAWMRRAGDVFERRDWEALAQIRHTLAADPQAVAFLEYAELDARGTDAGWPAFRDFLETQAEHPHWFPNLSGIRRNAERALAEHAETEPLPPAAILAHFRAYPAPHEPLTGAGAELHAEALLALGYQAEGEAAVRAAWRTHPRFHSRAGDFFQRHGHLLSPADHETRLDSLLWQEDTNAVRAMLSLSPSLVSEPQRRLAAARLRLMTRAPGVDAAIDAVPPDMLAHPALAYERARWRRRMGRDASAADLLLQTPPPQSHQRKWWRQRHPLARNALQSGDYVRAYHLAAAHGAEEGIVFAEGEFLAGWLALRFLDNPQTAYRHFQRLHAGVTTPVSQARALYWLGRAAQAQQDTATAQAHWQEAAALSHVYYGQLASDLLPAPCGGGKFFVMPERNGSDEKGGASFGMPAREAAVQKDRLAGAPPARSCTNVRWAGKSMGGVGGVSPPKSNRTSVHNVGVGGFAPHMVQEASRLMQEASPMMQESSRIAALAYAAGMQKTGERLLLTHARHADDPKTFAALTAAAESLGQKHLALRIAKQAARKHIITPALYPLDAVPLHALTAAAGPLEPALMLAIARQESEFDPSALSSAGARGMMQLMPATAHHVSQSHSLPYNRDALLQDVGYNLRLGSVYLAEMLARFDGSLPLAAAAYNAGPSRVSRWLREICDPRQPNQPACDSIDWIERIPIAETRNYVQRVTENLRNYRRLLADAPPPPPPVQGDANQ